MRVVIVDDEVLAVQYLSKVLADIGKTKLIATYTSSLIAKDEIVSKKPDIVFLDIEMPKMNGLELGSYIRNALPDVKIVFITSYEQYALKAIEIGDIDYILKPFEPSLIEEIINELSQSIFKEVKSIPMICLLGTLRFIYYQENEAVEVTEVIGGKWRTKLAREIFIYMLNSRGKYIRKDVLIETFWPDLSVKEGYNILYATIHYIRKFLKDINFRILIENSDEYYRLHINGVLIDIDYWFENTRQINDPMDPKFQKVTDLYKNHYLVDESYSWIEYDRQRYRIKWLEVIRQIISMLQEREEYSTAILYALKYQHVEPYMEESYFTLMKLFAETRDYKSVYHEYNRLKKMMEKEYNENPDKDIVEWYTIWKNSNY